MFNYPVRHAFEIFPYFRNFEFSNFFKFQIITLHYLSSIFLHFFLQQQPLQPDEVNKWIKLESLLSSKLIQFIRFMVCLISRFLETRNFYISKNYFSKILNLENKIILLNFFGIYVPLKYCRTKNFIRSDILGLDSGRIASKCPTKDPTPGNKLH